MSRLCLSQTILTFRISCLPPCSLPYPGGLTLLPSQLNRQGRWLILWACNSPLSHCWTRLGLKATFLQCWYFPESSLPWVGKQQHFMSSAMSLRPQRWPSDPECLTGHAELTEGHRLHRVTPDGQSKYCFCWSQVSHACPRFYSHFTLELNSAVLHSTLSLWATLDLKPKTCTHTYTHTTLSLNCRFPFL